jgi:hypothetical protein
MSRYLISDLHSPVFSLLQHSEHCIQTATNTATATYIFTATTRYSYTASLQLIQLIAIATPTLNRRTPVQTPFQPHAPPMQAPVNSLSTGAVSDPNVSASMAFASPPADSPRSG